MHDYSGQRREARMDHEAAAKAKLTERLLDRRILLPTGVRGLFGRGRALQDIVARLERLIDDLGQQDGAERVRFPPVIAREIIERVGYMEDFPGLCGSVHAFAGDDRKHRALLERVKQGADWKDHLDQTDIVLAPAACYPLYPTLTGTLPEGGALFDVSGICFRHEPSDDPMRMQSFELHENVRAGTPEEVVAWRGAWLNRGLELLESLGLPAKAEIAADPFFGRRGSLMRSSQHDLELKFEVVVPVWSGEHPTAVASFNYHQDKFGSAFDIRTHDGACAHTACLGFGIDRLAIALLHEHGLEVGSWPHEVRARLFP